jgi:zinc/manganese transport system permease protein
VLLVFAYLVVPAAIAVLLVRGITRRLLLGWLVGALVSAAGLVGSYRWDLPTGAAIVAAFGAALALTALALGTRATVRAVRARGLVVLRPGVVALAVLVALAGLLLILVPTMDHWWLDAIERAAPAVQETFLTPTERAVRRDALRAVAGGDAQLAELRRLQQDVQWGARTLDAEGQERLRQFMAGRGELTAGDRMVLRTLRSKARERQRYWLGVPVLALGAGGALMLARRPL